MTTPKETALALQPVSLMNGVFEMAASRLMVKNIRHRSALQNLQSFDGSSLVGAIYNAVRLNYIDNGASANKDRSQQNWRWHSPQPQISYRNRSPEVVVERAVAAACVALGRADWSNQIPVASGLVDGARDGRRAIDLVQRISDGHFRLIELKIASDTPLYAAIELFGYACLWLLARGDRPLRPSALLDADRIDLRVLAPADFYAGYSLGGVEASFHEGAHSLGEQHGVDLSFAFDVLDERIRADSMPDPDMLLKLVGRSVPLHPA